MKIALLGFGVVGRGVYDICQTLPGLEVVRILRRKGSPRELPIVTDCFEDIVNDPSVDCVVEAMGGLHPAREYLLACMAAGKQVVTSNKAVLAAFYDELSDAARSAGVAFGCEACVAGGVPFLAALRKAARVSPILGFSGILNGTTNYILSRMVDEGADFGQVLSAAQQLGYAEADPSADVDGLDVQNKAIVTCGIAFGFAPSHGQVPTFGIGSIQGQDVADILSMGRVPKLLATARREGDSLCCTVEPVLVERGSLEAAVPLNNNLASLEAQGIGTLKFYGQGAGALPTGNAVVQDLLDIAQGCKDTPPRTGGALQSDLSLLRARWWLRLSPEAAQRAKEELGAACESVRPRGEESVCLETAELPAQDFYALRSRLLALDPKLFAARFA
ncbi:MAG TPA: homoserine dehydrogenase [Candidatus Galloscillospira excrementipullorum]|nr:homoserine dehydrogenase [Candidatus Galloscillospira excrementipullorum]